MTNEEALLIDIKFQLDMYGSGQGSAEDALARVREIIFSPSLTDDQQVVLEYLKSRYHDRAFPFDLVGGLNSRFFSGPDWETDKVLKAYGGLNSREQFQVLAAFAEWGLSTLDN